MSFENKELIETQDVAHKIENKIDIRIINFFKKILFFLTLSFFFKKNFRILYFIEILYMSVKKITNQKLGNWF